MQTHPYLQTRTYLSDKPGHEKAMFSVRMWVITEINGHQMITTSVHPAQSHR